MDNPMMAYRDVRLGLNKIRAAEVPKAEMGSWEGWSKILDQTVEQIIANSANCNLRYVLQTGIGELNEVTEHINHMSKHYDNRTVISLDLTNLEDDVVEAVLDSLTKCECASLTQPKENL